MTEIEETKTEIEETTEAAEATEAEVVEADEAEDAEPKPVKKRLDFDEYDEVFSYNVEVGGETRNFLERLDGVAWAKEETTGNERTAFLTRSDERMRMQFREGALTDFVLETRKGRKI